MATNASVIADLTTSRGQPREFRESQKSLFTPRGSWVCGQPAGLSKRLSGNCAAVIHGRGISTAVSQSQRFCDIALTRCHQHSEMQKRMRCEIGPTEEMLPSDGFLTSCVPLYTGKTRLIAISCRLDHLSTLHLFWGLLGLSGAFFMAFPEELHFQNISLAIAPVPHYTHAALEPISCFSGMEVAPP
jgi:hypothetical protein